MPNIGDTPCVDSFFNTNNKVKEEICNSMSSMIGPAAALMLTALARDIMAGILSRNDRPDVQAAIESLDQSIAAQLAIDANLDG